MRIKAVLSAAVFILLLSGCATVYNPATKRQEAVLVGSREELNMGQQINKQVLAQYKVSKNEIYRQRVNDIGAKLARVSERQDIPYKFEVVESKDVNAFTIPGGYVYTTTALMENVANDDELAAVLAHEIGHIAARHAAKKIQTAMGYNVLMATVYALEGEKLKERWRDISLATNVTFELVSLGYSRRDEIAADLLGLNYLKKSGYDPYAMISFFEKLKRIENEKPVKWMVFLRSHPYLDDRIAIAKKELGTSVDAH